MRARFSRIWTQKMRQRCFSWQCSCKLSWVSLMLNIFVFILVSLLIAHNTLLLVLLMDQIEHVPGAQLDTSRSSRHLEGVDELDEDEGVVQLSSISINGARQLSGDIQDFALPKGNL